MHIAVLQGGLSKEREVSLASGKGVIKALKKLGYQATPIDAGKNLAAKLEETKPDIVFNALHGTYGEDGCIQGMLELLGIPYTHSGVLASAIAFDKPYAKKIFKNVGIPCAPEKILTVKQLAAIVKKGKDPIKRPYVIKPAKNGSSVGITMVWAKSNSSAATKLSLNDWEFGEEVLVEKYIPGKELSVAVLDGKALGAVEIRTKKEFFSYNAKYTAGNAEHIIPPEIPESQYKKLLYYAEKAHTALGCRGLTRSDFRYNDVTNKSGRLYILEINTHPGLTPLSLAPDIAHHAGISYEELVDTLVKSARCDNVNSKKK